MSAALRGSRRAAARICAVTMMRRPPPGRSRGPTMSPPIAPNSGRSPPRRWRKTSSPVSSESRAPAISWNATVVLPGWEDCAFYGLRTYTCDSQGFKTAEKAIARLRKSSAKIKACLRDGWAEDQSRHPGIMSCCTTARQVAAITHQHRPDGAGEHIVRLILFLRSR